MAATIRSLGSAASSLRISAPRSSLSAAPLHRPQQIAVGRGPLLLRRSASSINDITPRIAQPSVWRSLIPKPLRRDHGASTTPNAPNPRRQRKEWNPFVVYIFMFLLIGSNAMNTIGIRNELLNFSQKTERQIALLKEVIRKVQSGEKVDIDAVLGTGDPEREADWEEALKEIESSDNMYRNEQQRRQQKALAAEAKSKQAAAQQPPEREPGKKRFGFY